MLGILGHVASAAAGDDGKLVMTCLEIPDIDRGAGLAIVLQTPSGKTYLYDTGSGYPAESGWVADFNAGRDLIRPFLHRAGSLGSTAS